MSEIARYASSRRILVVDDDPLILKLMEKMLLGLGFSPPALACNGAEALKAMLGASEPIDLVLSDLNMGPVNGLELLKVIRVGYDDIDRATRLIVFTSLVDMALVPPALDLDVNGFLAKPVDREVLKTSIEHAFEIEGLVQQPDVYRHVHVPATSDLEMIAEKLGLPSLPKVHDKTDKPLAASLQTELDALDAVTESEVVPTPMVAGHLLARDIISHDGHLLLAAGQTLTRGILGHIVNLQKIDKSLGHTIFIVDE